LENPTTKSAGIDVSYKTVTLVISQAGQELQQLFDLLVSVTGIAAVSAIQLLDKLLVLPDYMSAKQWLTMVGLDPRQHQSGSSVNKKALPVQG